MPVSQVALLRGGARCVPHVGSQEAPIRRRLLDLPGSRALSQGRVTHCQASVLSMGFGGEAAATSSSDQARRR